MIDALAVARDTGMGTRINTVMQTCFLPSRVLPRDQAIGQIKKAIEKTYGKRGPDVVKKNFAAVDQTLENLHTWTPAAATASRTLPPIVSDAAPDFVKRVTALMLANKGDLLPVSVPGGRHRPRPPHSGRNTTSLKIFPSGIRLFASSATNAQWSARMPPFAPRSTSRIA